MIGKELIELADRCGGDAGEHVAEVGKRLHLVSPASGDEGVVSSITRKRFSRTFGG